MEISQMSMTEYNQKFSPLVSHKVSEETLELYRRVGALPIGQYLVLSPGRGEKSKALRYSVSGRLSKMAVVVGPKR